MFMMRKELQAVFQIPDGREGHQYLYLGNTRSSSPWWGRRACVSRQPPAGAHGWQFLVMPPR